MGFYVPAQIVRDAREHGVEVRAVDVNHSFWDCTLEPLTVAPAKAGAQGDRSSPGSLDSRFRGNDDDGLRYALRLGLRQIKGFAEADAERLVAARGKMGYSDPHALWRRSGLGRGAIERLAEADAFRSIGLDRRRALWALRALGEPPLPLFAREEPLTHPAPTLTLPRSRGREWEGAEREARAMALMPEMPLGEHVVEDYASLSLTLKRHPLAFLRREFAREGLVTAAELAHLPVDRRLAIAGVVLIRQR